MDVHGTRSVQKIIQVYVAFVQIIYRLVVNRIWCN